MTKVIRKKMHTREPLRCEKLSARVRSANLVVIAAIATGLLHDLYKLDQPWIRSGVAWTLCIVVYLFGPAFENLAFENSASKNKARGVLPGGRI